MAVAMTAVLVFALARMPSVVAAVVTMVMTVVPTVVAALIASVHAVIVTPRRGGIGLGVGPPAIDEVVGPEQLPYPATNAD